VKSWVADRCGDEAGDQDGDRHLAEADGRLDEQDPGGEWAAEERRDRREGPGERQHSVVVGIDVDDSGDGQTDDRAERD
jgi:hypothetical protein